MKTSQDYFSFLICDHPAQGVKNLFVNGLPIGVLRGDVWEPDPLLDRRIPSQTLEEFADYLREILENVSPVPGELDECLD